MIIRGKHKSLTINSQRNYITLRTPNGNYTCKFSGATASGKLAHHPTAFKNIDNFIMKENKKTNYGEAMKKLLDPDLLTELWPEWNEAIQKNEFKIGDNAIHKPDSIFRKKYPKGGKVVKVARKNVYLQIEGERGAIGFDYNYLIKK